MVALRASPLGCAGTNQQFVLIGQPRAGQLLQHTGPVPTKVSAHVYNFARCAGPQQPHDVCAAELANKLPVESNKRRVSVQVWVRGC